MCYQWKAKVAPFLAWCSCGHMNVTHDSEGRCFLCELLPLMPWADGTPTTPAVASTRPRRTTRRGVRHEAHVAADRRARAYNYHYQPRTLTPEIMQANTERQTRTNEKTKRSASRLGKHWSQWEKDVALNPQYSLEVAALRIGRSYKGVANARWKFRKDRAAALTAGRHNAPQLNKGKTTS